MLGDLGGGVDVDKDFEDLDDEENDSEEYEDEDDVGF